MKKRPKEALTPAYYLFRLANVVVRPATIFAAASILGDSIGSIIAIAYTMSGWLMVPMSLGSYRWTLPFEFSTRSQIESDYSVFKSTYLTVISLSVILAVLPCMAVGLAISESIAVGLVVFSVTVFDCLAHESSRRILYSGRLNFWALFLIVSNLALPVGWALSALWVSHQNQYSEADLLSAFLWVSVAVAIAVVFAFVLVNRPHRFVFSVRAFQRRLTRGWRYAMVALFSKSHQHIDKLLVGLINPDWIWIIAIVNYVSMLPVMAYEMVNLARLKSRIINMSRAEIMSRTRIENSEVVFFLLVSIPAAIAIGLFLAFEQMPWQLYVASLVYFAFAWAAIVAMKRTELLFWRDSNATNLYKIEFRAFLTNGIVALLISLAGLQAFALKVPSLLAAWLKVSLVGKPLRRKKGNLDG